MNKVLYLILLISSAIIFFGCDDTITVQDVDNREIPDSNVSFSKDIAPIFELKCVSCHGNGGLEGGVDLTTWAGVVDPRIVIPGEADTSPLVWTIEQRPGFPAMPPVNSPFLPLTFTQTQGVITWIDEGAKNN
jgi:hypothetical protein